MANPTKPKTIDEISKKTYNKNRNPLTQYKMPPLSAAHLALDIHPIQLNKTAIAKRNICGATRAVAINFHNSINNNFKLMDSPYNVFFS